MPDALLPSLPRRCRSSRLLRGAIVCGGLLPAIAVGMALLRFINLGVLAALAASRLLDHPIAIGELHVVVGQSLMVVLRGISLANVPDGSEREMAALRSLDAEIALLPLLAGRLQLTSLTIDSPTLLLERNKAGRGSWQFGSDATPIHSGIFAWPVRAALSIIVALTLRGGDVAFRTISGARLHIELHDVALHALAADQSLVIATEGAYDGAPIRLVVNGQSIDVTRNP